MSIPDQIELENEVVQNTVCVVNDIAREIQTINKNLFLYICLPFGIRSYGFEGNYQMKIPLYDFWKRLFLMLVVYAYEQQIFLSVD